MMNDINKKLSNRNKMKQINLNKVENAVNVFSVF